MQKLKKGGFTLVELIVVITILAILGTIAFISLQGYSRDARDSTRTADLNNIKTSLELYSLKTGKYPSPDSFSTITYSGGTENVWFQGVVGDQVTTNLKNLNEKPLDPLTSVPYTYSVTNSYKEYEVLALYEGNVAYNPILNQANAAVTSLTPRIVGNYNGVFVRTKNYIIPVPSIVTSETIIPGSGSPLTSSSINSLVVTNGINIPSNSLTPVQTGSLNINLSVYTGSITKSSGKTAMITAIKQIQNAYTGTTLTSNNNIAYILNQTTNDQIIALGNTTILKGQEPLIVVQLPPIITLTSNGFTHTSTTLSGSNIELISTNIYPQITFNSPYTNISGWARYLRGDGISLNRYCLEHGSTQYISTSQYGVSGYWYDIMIWNGSTWTIGTNNPNYISQLICENTSGTFTVEYNTSGSITQTNQITTTVDYNTLTLSYNETLNGQTLTPKLIINGVEKSLVNKVYTGLVSAGSTIKVKFIFTGTISVTPQLNNSITLIGE